MFEIFLTDKAKKQIKKLNQEDQKRILAGLERCQVRPHAFVKKLIASPYFRLRIGKFRVILDIQSKKLIIAVIEVGHRKNIYK